MPWKECQKMDKVERLTIGAQQSWLVPMGLKRCMFFFTSNYLSKVDQSILNRCLSIVMNQITPSAYVPLGQFDIPQFPRHFSLRSLTSLELKGT